MAKKSDGRTILNATAVKDQMIASLFFHKESCKKTTKFLYDLDGCRGQSNEKPLIGCEAMRMRTTCPNVKGKSDAQTHLY